MEWAPIERLVIWAGVVYVAAEFFLFVAKRSPKYFVSAIGFALCYGAPRLPFADAELADELRAIFRLLAWSGFSLVRMDYFSTTQSIGRVRV